jgi:hypothetical protein
MRWHRHNKDQGIETTPISMIYLHYVPLFFILKWAEAVPRENYNLLFYKSL